MMLRYSYQSVRAVARVPSPTGKGKTAIRRVKRRQAGAQNGKIQHQKNSNSRYYQVATEYSVKARVMIISAVGLERFADRMNESVVTD